MKSCYFVTGISTEVGKTIASAIIVEALQADYWKPIQSGDLDNSDTRKVHTLISNTETKFHPNSYSLKVPRVKFILQCGNALWSFSISSCGR